MLRREINPEYGQCGWGGVGADVGAVDADRQVLLESHNHDTTLTSNRPSPFTTTVVYVLLLHETD